MTDQDLELQEINPESDDLQLQGSPKKKRRIWRELRLIVIIFFMVLIFRSVCFEPFRIPSGSMIPSLMIGDLIIVNKMAYGVKVPFSDFSFMDFNSNPIYLAGKSDPQRGDVVVFKYPKDKSINYVKRVIGLPGDTIEIKNKKIFINDIAIETKEISGGSIIKEMDDKFTIYNLKFFESLTGEHRHIIQQDSDNYYQVNFDKLKIPPGKFFVMGDNRDFSYDSRFWGLVSREDIKGKAIYVGFSLIMPKNGQSFRFRENRFLKIIN